MAKPVAATLAPRRFTEPWIKMRTGLARAPQVAAIKRALGLPDVFAVIGRLHGFWSWWDEKSSHGRCDGAVTQDVDEIVHTQGFGDALAKVGWLGEDERGLYIPEADKHNGSSAKQRAMGNQRQARHRARNGDGDAFVTPKSRASNATNVTQSKNSSSNKQSTGDKNKGTSSEPPRTSTPVEEPPRSTPPPASASTASGPAANGGDHPDQAPIPESVRAAVRANAAKTPRRPRDRFNGHDAEREQFREPDWWESPAGIQREGRNRGVVPRAEDEGFEDFAARVFLAAGEGPWMQQASTRVRERIEHWRLVGPTA